MSFSLGQAPGARLYRGRELVGSRLAWAGFGYVAAARRRALRLRREHRAGRMTSVLLVYPFFRRSLDRSRFRFPPLGVGLRGRRPARGRPRGAAAGLHLPEPRTRPCAWPSRRRADVVGVYCMATMRDDCLALATALRGRCAAAAWPAARCRPASRSAFLAALRRGRARRGRADHGRAARRPRGRRRARRRAGRRLRRAPPRRRRAAATAAACAPPRPFAPDLDALPFPARDLLPNAAYIAVRPAALRLRRSPP